MAVDILGPMMMATRTRAKHVLVMTDIPRIAVPLVSTDASDVAQANAEPWVLRFGTLNALRTDHGKVCGSKLIKEMCRLLGIDVTPTLPYKPERDFKVLCGEPKDVGYDVAVFEFFVQHDYSSDDGSDAIQSVSWSGMPVLH